ncbi:unnamed protein product [Auanema sp. JU1783]|nr:unnamed protein product [Auanema sp. JU1783]
MFYYDKIYFMIIFSFVLISTNSESKVVKCKIESFIESLTNDQKNDLLYLWMNYTKGYCRDNLNNTSVVDPTHES